MGDGLPAAFVPEQQQPVPAMNDFIPQQQDYNQQQQYDRRYLQRQEMQRRQLQQQADVSFKP